MKTSQTQKRVCT